MTALVIAFHEAVDTFARSGPLRREGLVTLTIAQIGVDAKSTGASDLRPEVRVQVLISGMAHILHTNLLHLLFLTTMGRKFHFYQCSQTQFNAENPSSYLRLPDISYKSMAA